MFLPSTSDKDTEKYFRAGMGDKAEKKEEAGGIPPKEGSKEGAAKEVVGKEVADPTSFKYGGDRAEENTGKNQLIGPLRDLDKEKVMTALANDVKPLMLASRLGELGIVREAIKLGAGVNDKSKRGSNALQMASEEGKLEVVTLLLEYGAELESVDYQVLKQ